MAKEKEIEPYPLTPGFARAVAYYVSCRPRFFGRVGSELESDAFPVPAHKHAVAAAKEIARENGSGPSSCLLVLQRLRRWMHEGKLALESINEVADEFDTFEDANNAPDEEGVILELAPVLRRRLQREVVTAAMTDYSSRGDLGTVDALIRRSRAIGVVDTGVGSYINTASIKDFAKLKRVDVMRTGIDELDAMIGGGMKAGEMGAFMAAAGGGKSMGLSHVTSQGIRDGLFCVYATLEVPREVVMARIIANLTGVPIDAVLGGSEEAVARLSELAGFTCIVKDFDPLVTTVDDIKAWVQACEEQSGRQVNSIAVDYLDKCCAQGVEFTNTHATALHVWEPFRLFCKTRTDNGKATWGWTATQSRGREERKGKKVKIDLEHVSDSTNKVRVVDLFITINERDGDELELFVAKYRTGKARRGITVMSDFSIGAIAPVNRTSLPAELKAGAMDLIMTFPDEPGSNG